MILVLNPIYNNIDTQCYSNYSNYMHKHYVLRIYCIIIINLKVIIIDMMFTVEYE